MGWGGVRGDWEVGMRMMRMMRMTRREEGEREGEQRRMDVEEVSDEGAGW